MGSARKPGDPAGDADPGPDEWGGPEEPDLLGFVAVPDLPSGRHATPVERVGFGTRLVGLLSAAGLPVVALGVALLASLVAGVSLLMGVVAISRVPDATPVAAPATLAPPTAGQAPADRSAQPQAIRPAPPTSPVPSPSPQYLPAYPDKVLRVARFTCEGTPIDLDEPRVFPPTGADLAYRTCEDGPHLDLDAASRFAVVDVPSATAGECLDAIRRSPSVGWLTPDQNVTACVLTSPTAAAAQRISQKLVRLRVESIDNDGTLLLSLAAWSVPAA